MNEERRKVLEMLAQGKISAEEADQLLLTLEAQVPKSTAAVPKAPSDPKSLRVVVENGGEHGERVNVCVPFQLLRAGVRLAALIPKGLQTQINWALKESGMQLDLNALKPEDLEELVNHLGALTVDVESKTEKVKVFCE